VPEGPAGAPAVAVRPQSAWSLTLAGLCVFTFAIVTYRFPVAELGVAIAAVGLVLHGNVRVPFPVWLYAAFIAWGFISMLGSAYADISLDELVEHLKILAIMLIAVNALRTERQLRFYLLFYLACFVLFPVRGVLVGRDSVFNRAVWNFIYSNPNDLAALSLIALGVALATMLSETRWGAARVAAAGSAVVVLGVILLTQSRGAFIGMVVGFGPGLVGLGRKRPVLLTLCAAVAATFIAAVVPDSTWQRLSGIEKLTSESTIAEADPEGSAEQRFEIQKTAWRIIMDHPVFGIGLGGYQYENAKYAPELGRKDTHNTYFNLGAEVGFPGLILWCTLFGSVLRYAYKKRRGDTSSLATRQAWLERALIGYLVSGSFGSFSALNMPYLVLAVLWSSATLIASQRAAPAPAAR
jgi:O-antigen ligase